jgi:methylated-DNA-[protein]-cysteine S-methyltransferase
MTSVIIKTILVTPVGCILLQTSETHLYGVELLLSNDFAKTDFVVSKLAQEAVNQLKAYFIDAQTKWRLPLAKQGTVFQRKVWQFLQTIPSGETRTYSELAQVLGTSARAVGNACRANPYAIVVPCHRVILKSGIGGYYGKTNGSAIDLKQWLLSHEHNEF